MTLPLFDRQPRLVLLVQVQPDDVVLDMCASPGGKTSRIAEYVTGEGFVVAVDRTRVKVQQLLDTCIEQGYAALWIVMLFDVKYHRLIVSLCILCLCQGW
jgi:16S rRNA C967 or C1407 C5-methylase (RsmB/RsmF family)